MRSPTTRPARSATPQADTILGEPPKFPREKFLVQLSTESDFLIRFAQKMTSDEEAAADLRQDTLERALKYSHTFDGRYMRAWLCKIMRNLFVSGLRRARWQVDESEMPLQIDTDEHLDLACEQSRLQRRVNQLSPKLRTILQTHLQLDSYQRTAGVLRLPIGTVKSRVSRAKHALGATA